VDQLAPPPRAPRPLAGIRVVETATYISGPYAGMVLADLGAEVIKIEPPRGDPLRRFGQPTAPMSAFFASCNRGKQSVVLDVKQSEGRSALLGLISTADVFITNWRAEAAARLRLDDATVTGLNPSLVRLWLSGFGTVGPMAAQPAFDATMQAITGMAYLQGDLREPRLVRTYLYDKTTGLMGAQSVLAALFARERTGTGSRIDLSMLGASAYFNFADMMADHTFLGYDSGTASSDIVAANNPVPTSDGWMVVSPVTVAQIRRTCEAVGASEDHVSRILGQPSGPDITRTLIDTVGGFTPSRTTADWLDIFSRNDVPAAPCLRLDDQVRDEQLNQIGAYTIDEWAGIGAVRQARYPAVFSAQGSWQPAEAPSLGAHTDAVLKSATAPRSNGSERAVDQVGQPHVTG
jgi:crotonobetainyl-CoA:carnitine CoA-transferase CaiB-like acyl-CoA transferase